MTHWVFGTLNNERGWRASPSGSAMYRQEYILSNLINVSVKLFWTVSIVFFPVYFKSARYHSRFCTFASHLHFHNVGYRRKHPELWSEFMKGHFCVSKSLIDFISMASDYWIEQETRALKVTGGRPAYHRNNSKRESSSYCFPHCNRTVKNNAWVRKRIWPWKQKQQNTAPWNHW